jgi:hypothetical protein
MQSWAGAGTAARCSSATQSEAAGPDRFAAWARTVVTGLWHHRFAADGVATCRHGSSTWVRPMEPWGDSRFSVESMPPKRPRPSQRDVSLECLRGLAMFHRFAELKHVRPRPLSCPVANRASLAESQRVRLVMLRPPGCPNTLPTGGRSTAALRRPSGLEGHFVSNAREGRSATCGFRYLSRTRPSPFILRFAFLGFSISPRSLALAPGRAGGVALSGEQGSRGPQSAAS